MSPKEKALQLYNRMIVDFKIDKWQSQQCALVAVDEIEKAERNALLKFNLINEDIVMHYWQLVKQEIEKL